MECTIFCQRISYSWWRENHLERVPKNTCSNEHLGAEKPFSIQKVEPGLRRKHENSVLPQAALYISCSFACASALELFERSSRQSQQTSTSAAARHDILTIIRVCRSV